MDYDDIDYFPRRGKRAERADAAKGEYTKQQNLEALRASGLKFHEINKGDVCVFRSPLRPSVDFFTRKNRWQVRGQKKTAHGTVAEFIAFVEAFHGPDPVRDLRSLGRVQGNLDALRSKPAQLSALGQVMAYDEFDHLTPEQQAAFDPASQDPISLAEARRPGLRRIVERLQRENPRMSAEHALAHAKVMWTNERAAINNALGLPEDLRRGESVGDWAMRKQSEAKGGA